MKLRGYNKSAKILTGLILSVGGTALMIFDWWTSDGSFEGSYLFNISFFICFIGALFLGIVLKHIFLFVFCPLLITFLIYGYSYFVILPKMEKEGLKTTGIVTKNYKKLSSDHYSDGIYYEYVVNGEKYARSIFNRNLKAGDSIVIVYYRKNPYFHSIK